MQTIDKNRGQSDLLSNIFKIENEHCWGMKHLEDTIIYDKNSTLLKAGVKKDTIHKQVKE